MLAIKEDIYSRIIEYGLIALVFVCPLIFLNTMHPELIKIVLAEVMIWTLAVVWLCRCIERKDFSVKRTPLNLPVLAFVFAVVVSLLFSRYPDVSMIEAIKYVSYAVLFFLAVNFINTEKKFSRIIKSLMLLTFIVCVYGLLQHYNLSWVVRWIENRSSSTFFNPDFFAAFLVMMLPIAVHLYFRKKKLISFIYLLLVIFMLNNILCTFTRAAWIGLSASLVFFGILEYRYFIAKKAKLISMIFMILILALLIFGSAVDVCPAPNAAEKETSTREEAVQRVGQSFKPNYLEVVVSEQMLGEGKVNESQKKPLFNVLFDRMRRLNYEAALRIFSDNMVVGSGIGTYGFMLPDYVKSKTLLDVYYRPKTVHAHNEYLQTMAETGLFGIIAFLWLISVYFFASISSARSRGKGGNEMEKRDLAVALAASVLAILVQNIFSVSMRYPSVAVFFWLLLGLAFAQHSFSKEKDAEKKRGVVRALLLIIIFACFLIFSFMGYRIILSDVYTSYAASDEQLNKAIKLNQYNLDPYINMLARAKEEDNTNLMIDVLKHLNRTVPDYFVVNYHLGLLYYGAGDYEGAMAELGKVRNRELVRKWLFFAQYRKEHNMKPWETVNATIYVNG